MILNIALLIAIIGCLGYFGYSPKFQLVNLEVRGLTFVSPDEFLDYMREELDNQKFLFIKHRNIFLTSESDLKAAMAERYLFNSVNIKKVYPNSLVFEINEKNIQYRLRSLDYEYLVDDKGQVVEKFQNFNHRPNLLQLSQDTDKAEVNKDELSTFDEGDQFPLIFLDQDSGLSLGQTILSIESLSFINEILIKGKSLKFGLKLISLPSINPESLTMKTGKGWDVIFNIKSDLTDQLNTLDLVINQRIGEENLVKLERIDLRLGDNIYYKYK